MEAIFDRSGRTVAWLADGAVLDREARALAFLDEGAVFSYEGRHLGWLHGGLFYDRHGRAVAFTRHASGRVSLPLAEDPPLPPAVRVPRIPPVPAPPTLVPVWSGRWSDVAWNEVFGSARPLAARA